MPIINQSCLCFNCGIGILPQYNYCWKCWDMLPVKDNRIFLNKKKETADGKDKNGFVRRSLDDGDNI